MYVLPHPELSILIIVGVHAAVHGNVRYRLRSMKIWVTVTLAGIVVAAMIVDRSVCGPALLVLNNLPRCLLSLTL